MVKKTKYEKFNIFLSIVVILAISLVGTVLLKAETAKQSVKSVPETNYSDFISEETPMAGKTALININTASKEELMLLPGIGETKAEAIIKYREKNSFKRVADILKVEGIGANLYQEIAENICIDS